MGTSYETYNGQGIISLFGTAQYTAGCFTILFFYGVSCTWTLATEMAEHVPRAIGNIDVTAVVDSRLRLPLDFLEKAQFLL